MFTYPWCPKCRSEAKRSDVPYGHASMLLLGEGSEATEPYNKYATFSIVAIYIWDSTVGIW